MPGSGACGGTGQPQPCRSVALLSRVRTQNGNDQLRVPPDTWPLPSRYGRLPGAYRVLTGGELHTIPYSPTNHQFTGNQGTGRDLALAWPGRARTRRDAPGRRRDVPRVAGGLPIRALAHPGVG
jgi:hypothetical protein